MSVAMWQPTLRDRQAQNSFKWAEKKALFGNEEEPRRKDSDSSDEPITVAKSLSRQDSKLALETLMQTSWLGPKGETYRISALQGLKATCVREDRKGSDGSTKTFDLWFDKLYHLLWWGAKRSSFLDLADILADPTKVSWYDGRDWSKNQGPRFEWSRSIDAIEESSEKDSVGSALLAFGLPRPEDAVEDKEEVAASPEQQVNSAQILETTLKIALGLEAPPGLAPPPGLEPVAPSASKDRKGDSSQDESDETRVGSEQSDSDTSDSTGGPLAKPKLAYKIVEKDENKPRTKLRSRADVFVPLPFVPAADVAAAWETHYARNGYYQGDYGYAKGGRCPTWH